MTSQGSILLHQLIYTWSRNRRGSQGYGVVGASAGWHWGVDPLDDALSAWVTFLEPEQLPYEAHGIGGVRVIPEHPFGTLLTAHKYVGEDGFGRPNRYVTKLLIDPSREIPLDVSLTLLSDELKTLDWAIDEPADWSLPDINASSLEKSSVDQEGDYLEASITSRVAGHILVGRAQKQGIAFETSEVDANILVAALALLPRTIRQDLSFASFLSAFIAPDLLLLNPSAVAPRPRMPITPALRVSPQDAIPSEIADSVALLIENRHISDSAEWLYENASVDALVRAAEQRHRDPSMLNDDELLCELTRSSSEERRRACGEEVARRVWEGNVNLIPPENDAATQLVSSFLEGWVRCGRAARVNRFVVLSRWTSEGRLVALSRDVLTDPDLFLGLSSDETVWVPRLLARHWRTASLEELALIYLWADGPLDAGGDIQQALGRIIGEGWLSAQSPGENVMEAVARALHDNPLYVAHVVRRVATPLSVVNVQSLLCRLPAQSIGIAVSVLRQADPGWLRDPFVDASESERPKAGSPPSRPNLQPSGDTSGDFVAQKQLRVGSPLESAREVILLRRALVMSGLVSALTVLAASKQWFDESWMLLGVIGLMLALPVGSSIFIFRNFIQRGLRNRFHGRWSARFSGRPPLRSTKAPRFRRR